MTLRRVLAALCIAAMILTGIGVAVLLYTHIESLETTASSQKSTLAVPEAKMPTPDEFKVGVQVTGHRCDEKRLCTYTYTIEPNYVGFHPLPKRDFAVFYEVTGGSAPQPGNFTVSGDQARVYKDVTVAGPPGAQLAARVTQISPVIGPKPIPAPNTAPEQISPVPINSPGPQQPSP